MSSVASIAVFPRLSLRHNFSWIAVGNVVIAACSWGRIVLLAHLGNAEMIGQLVLALAICNPIDTMADLGLGGVLVSDAKREHRFGDYLGLRLLTTALTLAAIASTAWAGGYEARAVAVILLAGLAIALESVSDIFHALLQQHERMDFVAISLMIRGPLGLALLTIGVWATGDIAWGVLGFPVAAAATLLLVDIPFAARVAGAYRPRKEVTDVRSTGLSRNPAQQPPKGGTTNNAFQAAGGITPRWEPSVLAGLAWLSLPLGLATAGMALTTAVPRYMVSHYLGREALGAFAVAGGLMVAASLLVGALSQAASPRLAHCYAAGDAPAFRRLLGRLVGLVAITGGGMLLMIALAGRPILQILYGPDFAQYADLALCLMLAGVLRDLSVPLGRAISSMRRFRANMVVRGVGIALLLVLLPVLIPPFGLFGAAWAMILAWLSAVLLSAGVVIRTLRRCEAAQRRISLNWRANASRIFL